MVTCSHAGQETIVEQVQVTDLENAAYLPKGRCIKGMRAGNGNWRSPKAHFKSELNKPTDMFSFGIMVSASPILQNRLVDMRLQCIYAYTGRVALSHLLATSSFVFW